MICQAGTDVSVGVRQGIVRVQREEAVMRAIVPVATAGNLRKPFQTDLNIVKPVCLISFSVVATDRKDNNGKQNCNDQNHNDRGKQNGTVGPDIAGVFMHDRSRC